MPHPFLAALVLFSALLTTQVTVAKPSLAPPSYVGPVLLDGQTLDEVWIFPRPEKVQFSIEATPLLEALRPTLKNENYQNLTRRVSPQGTLSLVDLEAVGFNVTHNEQTLELRLELPLKYRKVNDLDLTGSNDGLRPLLRPSAHSGYLNLRTQQNYQYGNAVKIKKCLSLETLSSLKTSEVLFLKPPQTTKSRVNTPGNANTPVCEKMMKIG